MGTKVNYSKPVEEMTDQELEEWGVRICSEARDDGNRMLAYIMAMGIDHELSRRKKADECHV